MNLEKAKQIANQLMGQSFRVKGMVCCAKELGYTFQWGRAKRRCGCCDYRNKVIKLDRSYVEDNEEADIRDTILHEMAHAFARYIYGRVQPHGPEWKLVCREIGCTGNRVRKHAVVNTKGDYELRHKDTGQVFAYYYRKPRRIVESIHNGRLWIRGKKQETMGKLRLYYKGELYVDMV